MWNTRVFQGKFTLCGLLAMLAINVLLRAGCKQAGLWRAEHAIRQQAAADAKAAFEAYRASQDSRTAEPGRETDAY
jgi:hypothetical protein